MEFEQASYTVTEGSDSDVTVCLIVNNTAALEPTDSFTITLVAETVGVGTDSAQGTILYTIGYVDIMQQLHKCLLCNFKYAIITGDGVDYDGMEVTAQITASNTGHCITVDIEDDTIVERQEAFRVRVTDQLTQVEATGGADTVPVQIIDNDG